jgi:3-oxoacyl-ACP reductase-like protein
MNDHYEGHTMSLFGTILQKLGIGNHAKADTQTPADAPATGGTVTAAPAPAPASAPAQAAAAAAAAPVDVSAKLDSLAAQSSEKLNWKTSIVDLLKLLNIDSSLANRKELAKELNYTGSTEDSAAMNIWLHKAVLTKLSQNGGQVPADLLD